MLLKPMLALAAAGLVGAFAATASAAAPRAVAIEDLTLVEEDNGAAPDAEPDQYHHGWYHHGGYHHGGYHHGGYHHGGYHYGGYHHGGYHHGGYHHGGYHHGGYHHGGYHHGYHHGGYHHGGYHHGYHHWYNSEKPPTETESLPTPKIDTDD
jgi:hypothetical protein